MFGFMVTADGGLTTAGYVITVIAGIILFLAVFFPNQEQMSPQQRLIDILRISNPLMGNTHL